MKAITGFYFFGKPEIMEKARKYRCISGAKIYLINFLGGMR